MIAAGTYPVSGPVVFEPADSGTANAPVIYQAEPGARPIFDGGRAITGFSRRPDGLWTAKVSDVPAGTMTDPRPIIPIRRSAGLAGDDCGRDRAPPMPPRFQPSTTTFSRC